MTQTPISKQRLQTILKENGLQLSVTLNADRTEATFVFSHIFKEVIKVLEIRGDAWSMDLSVHTSGRHSGKLRIEPFQPKISQDNPDPITIILTDRRVFVISASFDNRKKVILKYAESK